MGFRVRAAAALAMLFAVALVACGRPAPTSSTVELVNGPVRRVVALVPSIAEDLYAVGAGGAVVGVSAYSDYPPAAKKLPQIAGFASVSTERVVALHPDLVVGIVSQQRMVADLRRAKIQTMLLHDDSYADIFNNLVTLGVVTGHERDAETFVRGLRARTAAILRSVTPRKRKPTVFVVLGTAPIFTVGRGSYIDTLIGMAGGRNAAGRFRAVRALQCRDAGRAPARRADRRSRHPLGRRPRSTAVERVAGGARAPRLRADRRVDPGTSGPALQRRARVAGLDAGARTDMNAERRLYPTGPAAQRALVVAVDLHDPQRPLAPELAEFVALAEAAGAIVVGEVVQRLARVDPATLVGSGKAREIADRAAELGADALFVYNDLRPRQRANLEKIVPLPIVDRTMLILDIFAQHARSREGQLQVELAQLRYRQSNLIGAGAALSRLGGGVGTRGPGETKLEVDRRKIQQRVSLLGHQLDDVRKQRSTRRAGRSRDPFVALVGYTNVGKSSLLNRLAGSGQGEGAFVADQPFATLDPTLRRAYVAPGVNVRLADTVGFITALPQELVNAFRATLEELVSADVLLHVHDASNPDWPRQKGSVEAILHELHLEEKPVIEVFNKIDRLDAAARSAVASGAVEVSAKSGEGIDALRAAIAARVAPSPPQRGALA